jgi:hypothetical protein
VGKSGWRRCPTIFCPPQVPLHGKARACCRISNHEPNTLPHSRHGSARVLPRKSAPPPHVRDDRETPLVEGRDGRIVSLIWGEHEAEFLCKQNWTGQIALIRHDKKAVGADRCSRFDGVRYGRVEQCPLFRAKPNSLEATRLRFLTLMQTPQNYCFAESHCRPICPFPHSIEL